MPNWKKVLVSGSNAHLNQVTASANIDVSGNIDVGGNLNVSQYIYHTGDANTYLNFTNDRLRFNIGGISYIDLNDSTSAPHDITFNDGGNNVDLTIKGSSNNPLFKTDASANRIGTHGLGSPKVAFHIGGSELRVDGNISGSSTGIGSFGSVFTATHVTASGNVEVTGNISGSITSTASFGAGQFSGNVTPKTDNDMDLGSSAKRWANIFVGDMELSNEGSEGNEVDGTTGKWTIQEGENSLYLLNRKTNKKYKFKIEEVD